MDLMTASPREVDEHAAELYRELDSHNLALHDALNVAHFLLGEKPTRSRGGKITGWPTSDSDIASRLRVHDVPQHEQGRQVKVLNALTELSDHINDLTADLTAVNVAFLRRGGWARFFTVDGGHIHSGMTCAGGTIRPSTRLGWNPELSGKTEADAVASLGPLLCTHCFPTAPIEWTKGAEKKHCEGSGKPPVDGTQYRVGMRWYGACTGCPENQIVTANNAIRAHRPPKN